MHDHLRRLFENLSSKRILVIGDFMLDEYIVGSVDRISPEAPVPVVEERRIDYVPGGAGNVVTNLRSLQAAVTACGIIGTDHEAERLIDCIYATGIAKESVALLALSERPTTRKTRIIAGNQQVCRLDREDRSPLSFTVRQDLLRIIETHIQNCHAVVLSDYDKGVIDSSLIEQVMSLAKARSVPVTVDPQVTNFLAYKNVFILTPNHHEAGRFLGRKLTTDADIERAGYEIIEKLNCNHILITRGERGMSLISPNRIRHVPTVAREVFDVTGAGDTVISMLTLAIACGADLDFAIELSNYAAGIVVGRIGAATVTQEDLAGFEPGR